MAEPMKALADLDDVTWVCPCGGRHVTDGPSPGFDRWLAEHRPHTDGTYVKTCTGRGATVWTSTPPPERGPL